MERETRELETPNTHVKVVVYTYLTGREFEYAQTPLLQAMKVKPASTGEDMSFGDIDVNKVQEATHRLLEKLVVSVDGKTEDTLNAVLDLPNGDYQYVVDELQDLSAKKN